MLEKSAAHLHQFAKISGALPVFGKTKSMTLADFKVVGSNGPGTMDNQILQNFD